MIGNLMSRMSSASKLSVQQLQQAIQDGTIPPYIGIPLLQDKVKQEQQASAPAAPQMPPIAEQVMQQASGIDEAKSNLPAAYAAGGIMHFANTGLVPEDEDSEDPLLQEMLAGMNNNEPSDTSRDMLLASNEGGIGPYITPFINSFKKMGDKISEHVNETPKVDTVTKESTSTTVPLKQRFLDIIQHIESRGQRYDKNGNLLESPKGAKGEMQVMGYTAKDPGFGVMPARDNSPDELKRVGQDYAMAMYDYYKDPKIAAMAYNAGPGRIDKWLASGMKGHLPKETVDYGNKMVSMISDYAEGGQIPSFAGPYGSLVTDAFRSGYDRIFGNTPSIPDPVAPPTSNYAVDPLSQEEARRAFQEREKIRMQQNQIKANPLNSLPKFELPSISTASKFIGNLGIPSLVAGAGYKLSDAATRMMQNLSPEEREQFIGNPMDDGSMAAAIMNQNDPNAPKPVTQTAAPAVTKPTGNTAAPNSSILNQPQPNQIPDWALQNAQAAQQDVGIESLMPTVEKEQTSTEPQGFDFMKAMQGNLDDLKKQKEEDKYMGIIATGLGIMGGTSPYALTNIGQGAAFGVKTYQDAAKQRAAEQAATYRNMLYGQHFTSADQLARAKLKQDEDIKTMLYGQRDKSREEKIREFDIGTISNIEKNAENYALANLKVSPMLLSTMSPQQIAAIKAPLVQDYLKKNKNYRELYKKNYNEDPFENAGSGGNTNVDLNNYFKK